MRALSVYRFCRTNGSKAHHIRIIVEVLNPATQRSAVWDEKYSGSIEVICPTKIHYKLMARSCVVKGLYTLITNLFTSELRLKHVEETDFLSEYFSSFDNEIYPVILAPAFYYHPFEEVAEIIFETFGSTMFALDTPVGLSHAPGRTKHRVLLFPKGRLIKPDDVGLVITKDLNTAHAISRFQSGTQDHQDTAGDFLNYYNRNTEEVGLLKRVRQSIDSSNILFTKASPSRRESSLWSRGHSIFPEDADSEFGLETQFRKAIQDVYTSEKYSEWRSKPPAEHISPPEGDNEEEVNSDSNFRFPKSVSLENAAEMLLAWPPLRMTTPPHPAVLEQREKEILDNLKERTLTLVEFNIPHILVCCQLGWPSNFFYFLSELRNPKSANPPVVILYPEEPSHTQWGCVGMFENVFLLKGSPKYELDLMRGGVIQAARIVILANQGQPVDLAGTGVMDDRFANRGAAAYTSDIGNILVAANVQRLYGDKVVDKVIVEMQHADAFHYLRPHSNIPLSQFRRNDMRRKSEALIPFGPPYMEGKATSLAMLGFLVRSSFLNRNTISIVEQLIMGGFAVTEEGLSKDRQRILHHMEVPAGYANRTFQKLFTYLLHERSMLAIGLYRVRGNLGAPTSYVFTNPQKGCIVNPDDLVYVIT
ncbi:hypothetical protein R1flu_004174 [Riccia fluitans]|uniref:Uncharacterized protein n=1 Tax=Riccia fluitans TaxID=41844 RepID=A0ABD1YQC5_9MARC